VEFVAQLRDIFERRMRGAQCFEDDALLAVIGVAQGAVNPRFGVFVQRFQHTAASQSVHCKIPVITAHEFNEMSVMVRRRFIASIKSRDSYNISANPVLDAINRRLFGGIGTMDTPAIRPSKLTPAAARL